MPQKLTDDAAGVDGAAGGWSDQSLPTGATECDFLAGMVAVVVLIIPVASLMRTIETLFVELEEL